MLEEWYEVEEFPGYSISNHGRVQRSDGRMMTISLVQYNMPTVGFKVEGDPRTHRRSVAGLVCKAFLPPPEREDFDTPIYLDGDRANVRVDNLMLRPRWLAINFNKERAHPRFPDWAVDIYLIQTGEVFSNPREAAVKYGLLETDVALAVYNEDHFTFPHAFKFRLAS